MAIYNKEQFLATVKICGYAQKKVAEKYADGRDSFTDDDLIAVYRIGADAAESVAGKREAVRDGFSAYDQHHKSTKRYKYESSGF